MAKFLALVVTLACMVGSVQCCRHFWDIIWPLLPPPPPQLPSPSSHDKEGSFSPPPLPYDHRNSPISPSPSPSSLYDNHATTSQPPSSPSRPPLPSSHVKSPSYPPSSGESGNKTKRLPQALAPSHVSDRTLFNVLHYGAKGNGRDDDSQAFKDAWDDACRSSSSSGIFVPAGRKYMLLPMSLSGPCIADITVQIDGELVAPEEPSKWGCSVCHTWIEFGQVDGLTIQGSGSFNGQGAGWWRKSFCDDSGDITDCHKKPTSLHIVKANNLSLRDLTFKDSPQMHIVIGHARHVHIDNLVIRAPGNSPNTDGIHIQNCEHVHISDSDIGTGDDCVSISNGSSDINVKGVLCGPGHGVSIGSLGKDGAEDKVENVHVKDIQFRGSTNGARIKTWQGGKGYAKNIVFEDITCDRVKNPIIITQFYCDHEICRTHASAVQISNVTFSNVKGSSFTEKAIELECSESHPCTDIILKDIDLHWTKRERETQSTCSNVQGWRNGNISPSVPCLAFDDKLGYNH